MTEEQRKALEEKIKKMSPEELKAFQKQQCIFCQIIGGKVPNKKVYEDDKCIAVLDINPAAKGHILLMPKEHYAIMPQMPEAEMAHLFLVSKYLSQLLLKVLKVGGTNVFIANGAAAGQRAQHFMLHVIPRKEGDKILEIEERLVPPELLQKIKIVIEAKLNEKLGVKKEAKPKIEEGKKEAATPLIKDKVEEPIPKEEKEEIEKEEKEEELDTEEAEKEPEQKTKGKAKKAPAAKKSANTKSKAKGNPDVSLDDIANLFK